LRKYVLTGILICLSAGPFFAEDKPVVKSKGRKEALHRWRDAKFGLFLHWGAYSVYGGRYKGKDKWSAEWIQENARIPWEEYSKTAAGWNPSEFDAEEWVKAASSAGMKYLVITSKHHDGFAMYPSRVSKYNLMDWSKYKGPDPLAELAKTCKKHGLLFGIYYSPLEFRTSPRGFDRKDHRAVENGFDYRTLGPKPYATTEEVIALARKQIIELCEYKPDILWFDGLWPDMGKWDNEKDSVHAEKAIRSRLPNILINNRLNQKHPDFHCHEVQFPKKRPEGDWELCACLGMFFGYNKHNDRKKFLGNPDKYIEILVKCTAFGGNYLLNIGPDSKGKFPAKAVEYLGKIGQWVKPNGECIYGASGSPLEKRPEWGYLTCRPGKVYLIVRQWADMITVPTPGKGPGKAYLLVDPDKKALKLSEDGWNWTVSLPAVKPTEPFGVVVVEVQSVKGP